MSMVTKALNSIPNRTFTSFFEKSVEKTSNDEDDSFASLDVK